MPCPLMVTELLFHIFLFLIVKWKLPHLNFFLYIDSHLIFRGDFREMYFGKEACLTTPSITSGHISNFKVVVALSALLLLHTSEHLVCAWCGT